MAHEDDAERAVRAALDVVEAVPLLGTQAGLELRARAGVLTGQAAVTVGAVGQAMVAGDLVNTQGYLTPVRLPQRSTFAVARLDHDFGDKWRFMASYRYYGFSQLTSQQLDIGGALPGDTLGQGAASAPRPQKPSFLVAGLNTTITANLTNDFHFSYLRNQWQWSTNGAPPQLRANPAMSIANAPMAATPAGIPASAKA